MIEKKYIVALLDKYECDFKNLCVTTNLIGDIKTDIQVEELIDRCSQDMISVDKITKLKWLQI